MPFWCGTWLKSRVPFFFCKKFSKGLLKIAFLDRENGPLYTKSCKSFIFWTQEKGKKMIKKMIGSVKTLAVTGLLYTMNPFLVFAAVDPQADVTYLTGNGNGAFDGVQNAAKETLASTYNLIFIISTGVLVIALMFGFLKLGLFKGQEREKQKGAIGWICVSIIGVTAALSIFTMIAEVSQGMF